jgi:hypothetical protein
MGQLRLIDSFYQLITTYAISFEISLRFILLNSIKT